MNPLIPLILAALLLVVSCTTRYITYEGKCITQQWLLSSFILRQREICELPIPDVSSGDTPLIDKKPVSPFPDFFDYGNPADTFDPNLLESQIYDMEGEDHDDD